MVIIAVDTRTLSTSIGLQVSGNLFDKFFVVIQKAAFVFEAANSYFLEWKKVISLFDALTRSLILEIFFHLYSDLFWNLIWVKIYSIFFGPLFSKKGLIINCFLSKQLLNTYQ